MIRRSSAHTAIGIALSFCAWTAAQDALWCEYPPGDGPGQSRHIVLISGDEEYRSEEALPMLGKILSQRHGFRVTVLFAIDADSGVINPNNQTNIPGMEAIDSADLVILALRYRHLPDEQMKHFADYVRAGKPLIGLRTSTHAFNYPGESTSLYRHFGAGSDQWAGGFGKHVLGETWVSHHGNHKVESTRGVIAQEKNAHPILRGVDDVWGPTDVYGINELPGDTEVLLHGQVLQGMKPTDPPVAGPQNEPMMPLAWTRSYPSESGRVARVFCTTMGSADDFLSAGLRRLIVNAAYWCLEMEDKIEPDSSVEFVGDYEPTPYGFNGFIPGKRPSDYALPDSADVGDSRLGPLRTLDGHFPFHPPETLDQWRERADRVRSKLCVVLGLDPPPAKTPLHGVIHGRREADDYIVEKAYFESVPGFFVTGNIYRPKNQSGPFPGILSPHGHWNQGRFYDAGAETAAREVAAGAEFDLEAARVPLQARCVHLARMGCIVFHYDMIGYADCRQIGMDVAHDFARQRPEWSSPERWVFFSPQAESHLQSIMGLQTWNSIRALDFLESFPDVDRSRIGVTGASGGGTQTMILGAVDPRPSAIFPAVMVSTSMQGGCTCENAPLLRVDSGNVEFAALFAPKPQGLTAANDWTRDMERDGFPQLQQVYSLYGKPDLVRLCSRVEFGHNYNAVSRAAMYEFFNDTFGLNAEVKERPFQRLTPEQLTVWDAAHPRPAEGIEFEMTLLQSWQRLQSNSTDQQTLCDESTVAQWKQDSSRAYRAILDRDWSEVVEQVAVKATPMRNLVVEHVEFVNSRRGQKTPAILIRPEENWNGRYVVCLNEQGKKGVLDGEEPADMTKQLVNSGCGVIGIDCYWQGELLPAGADPRRARLVENGREAAGYTFGYNEPTLVHQVQDVMNAVTYLRHTQCPTDLWATDSMSPVAGAVCAIAGDSIRKVVLNTQGFRFAQVNDLRDVRFLPGGAKFGDLPAMIAMRSPHDLWLVGESQTGDRVDQVYAAQSACSHLLRRETTDGAVAWLAQ